MPSSTDIAQLFASQQGQFSQSNYFAQTIGVQQLGMGLGGNGFFGPGSMQRSPGPMPPPGVAPPPPVFSYNFGGFAGPGYGGGNAAAGGVMSGLGGAAAAGGIGLGLASMMSPGSMMGRLGGMMDPVSAFLRNGPAIPLLNAGGTGTMMGGLAAAAAPMAIGAGAMMMGRAFMHGGQQQAGINAQVGQFSFLNQGSRSGQGFTRQDATDIGGTIRQLGHLPEMLSSVEELTRMLPKMRQMGVMQGVKDVAEFQKRFKDTINTVRDVSKILGTTMEEASEFFAHSKQAGFNSRGGQIGNALQAQYTSGATGMTMGQVMGMQGTGSAMARQFGGRGRAGAQGVMNIAQKIQAGIEGGYIDEGTVTDATGLTGPDGIKAASEKMFGINLAMTQTAPGQLALAGLMRKGKDGYEIDQEMLQKLNNREIGVGDLKGRASALGIDSKIAFKGTKGRAVAAQLAAGLDTGSFMSGILEGKGEGAPELVISQLMGGQVDDATMDLIMSQGKGQMGMSQGQHAQRRGQEMKIRERSDPKAIMERIKRKLHSSVFGGVEELGAKAYGAIGQAYDDMIDDLVGRHIVELSKEGAQTFENAMSGGSKAELKEMVAAANGLRVGGDGKIEPKMTAGRMAKMAVSGVVGLGVGIATGFNPLAGGAAAMGTMALLSSWDAENSDMSNSLRSAGLEGSTGRTPDGIRDRMETLTGLKGLQFDEFQRIDREGMKAGGEAEKVFRRIRGETVQGYGAKWETWDPDAKFEIIRQASLDAIAAGLPAVDAGDATQLTSGGDLGKGKWDTVRYDALIKELEKNGSSGVAAAMKAVRTSGMDPGTAMVAGVKQEKGGWAEVDIKAAKRGELKSMAQLKTSGEGFKDAQSELRSVFGTEAGVLESNRNLRKAAERALSETSVMEAITNSGAEGGTASLQAMGINLSGSELSQLRDVLAKAKGNAEAKGVLGKYSESKGAKDEVVIRKQLGEVGEDLSKGTNKAVKGLSAAMKAAGAGGSFDDVEAAQMALVDEYQATAGNKPARDEIERQMTPAMREALQKGNKNTSKSFSGKSRDAVIEQLKKQYGNSLADPTLNSIMGGVGVKGDVTPQEAERLRDKLASLEISKTITGSAGGLVATHEDKIVAALSLQTELLGIMVKNSQGVTLDKGMETKLGEINSTRLAQEKLGS